MPMRLALRAGRPIGTDILPLHNPEIRIPNDRFSSPTMAASRDEQTSDGALL
jgi:hypothetical protein